MRVFDRDKVFYRFEYGMEEAYRIKDGERFVVDTNDCFLQQLVSEEEVVGEIDFDNVNAATGPFYIEGAEAGDILKIDIIDIETEDKGVAVTMPGGGVLGEYVKESITRVFEKDGDKTSYAGVDLPISPMIGVIGVAPSKEEGAFNTAVPWKHGGNMDSNPVRAENSIYLQVQQDGAMLGLGDLHLVMGDGEVTISGVEIPGRVTLEVNVIKSEKSLEWPVVETEDEIMLIVSGENTDKAIETGLLLAIELVREKFYLSFEEAYIMVGQACDVAISQLVNEMKTIRIEIPKNVLNINDIL